MKWIIYIYILHTFTPNCIPPSTFLRIPQNVLDKPECKRCAKALQELENIDDEADQLGIGFVKIHDAALADEYNLGSLPALVYYRHQIPILFEGYLFLSFSLWLCVIYIFKICARSSKIHIYA